MKNNDSENREKIDVDYLANLARVYLSQDEINRFQGQLNSVVDYVNKINSLDLEDIEPTSHAAMIQNVFRKDGVSEGLDHNVIMENAPYALDEMFGVPKIIE